MKRRMSPAKRLAIWTQSKGLCGICGYPIEGAWEADHWNPLWIAGDDSVEAFQATHEQCHREKTKQDVRAIAKIKRIIRKADPETRKAPTLRSRGFDKTLRRTFSGRVERRG